MGTIEKTTDYKQFKLLECNRTIMPSHVTTLRMSIEMNNLLHLRPIMVNSQMEVIDGQHRLMAAQELGVPVYYVKDEKLCDSDLIDINNTQKNWSQIDYFNYYLNKGKIEYVKLKELSIKLNLPIDQFVKDMVHGGNSSLAFKKGTFKLNENIDYVDLYSKYHHLKEMTFNYLSKEKRKFINTRTFRRAFFIFMQREDVNYEVFKRKIEMHIGRLKTCLTTYEYLEMLAFIYNYRNQSPIAV